MALTATLSAVPASVTEAQLYTLNKFGITAIPNNRAEASAMIANAIATRDMRPASVASVGKLGVLGGRDLPGAGQREISTAITLVEALLMIDNTEGVAKQEWLEELANRVRARLTKPITVHAPIHTPVEDQDF